MSRLNLFLFGLPCLERDGQPINITRRKPKALLAYLALNPQTHSREMLTTVLWPEYDARRARADLSRTLSVLNKSLGDGWLVTDRETVTLNPHKSLSVDVANFKQLLAPCETHDQASVEKCAICLSNLTEAVALYQADFLAGFTLSNSPAFDEWQRLEAELRRQELAGGLEKLGRGYGALGEWEKAIEHTRRWVGIDTLHEPAHRQLMRLYAQSDQRAAALAQYETCCRILIEELNVEPSEETRTLHHQIRAGELRWETGIEKEITEEIEQLPVTLPDFLSTTPPPGPSTLFVARERELKQLDAHWESALAGQGRIVFVSGEAGRGKTSLLGEFARRTQKTEAGVIVAAGNCNAYAGVGDPYLPFRDVMGMLTGDVEAKLAAGAITIAHARQLWQLMPYAIRALTEEGPHLIDIFVSGAALKKRVEIGLSSQAVRKLDEVNLSPSDNREQLQLFEQYTNVLRRVAGFRPLLLLLDDLQWADNASINLLFHLGRRIAGSHILILGAYRPSEVGLKQSAADLIGYSNHHPLKPIIKEFIRRFGNIEIDLRQNSQAEARGLIDALIDTEPNGLGESFRTALFERTQGHPLFSVELIKDMQERGDLIQNKAGAWVEARKLDWMSLPARVEAVIEQRLDRLSNELQDLLTVASVEGEVFTAQVVAQIQGVEERILLRWISRELEQRHGLVREYEEVTGEHQHLSRYQFSHALFQQYLYNKLSQGERRLLHHEVAQALEALYAEYPHEVIMQLAHHRVEAGEQDKAIAYLVRAGDRAKQLVALQEAVTYYQAALNRWPGDANPAEQAEIMHKLGECLWITGRLPEALTTFEGGYELYQAIDDKIAAGAMQRLIGRVYWERGERQLSLRHYHQALSILENEPESVELARVVSAISQMYMLASEYDEAIAWGERALTLAERLGAEDVFLHALNNVGSSYLLSGRDFDRGLAMLKDSLDRALVLNLPHDACRAYLNLGEGLKYMERYQEAHAHCEEMFAYATRVHAPYFINVVLALLAELEWLTGKWAASLIHCRQLIETRSDVEAHGGLRAVISTLLGWINNDLGRTAQAQDDLEKEVHAAIRSDERQITVPHLGQLIRTYTTLGLISEAEDSAMQVLEWITKGPYIEPSNIMPLMVACQWFASKVTPESLAAAQKCIQQLERAINQFRSTEADACLSEARAYVALAEGVSLQASKKFRQAATQWESLDRPYDQARALSGSGQALSQIGETDQAKVIFDQGWRLIDELATQLEDPDLNSSFLNSPLVQKIRVSRSQLSG